jgi:hypothetical protein
MDLSHVLLPDPRGPKRKKLCSGTLRISESAAGNITSNSHVIQLFIHCTQAALGITKTFAVSKLGKRHAHELVQTCKGSDTFVAAISANALPKIVHW